MRFRLSESARSPATSATKLISIAETAPKASTFSKACAFFKSSPETAALQPPPERK